MACCMFAVYMSRKPKSIFHVLEAVRTSLTEARKHHFNQNNVYIFLSKRSTCDDYLLHAIAVTTTLLGVQFYDVYPQNGQVCKHYSTWYFLKPL